MSIKLLRYGISRFSPIGKTKREHISLLLELGRSIFQCSVAKNITIVSNDELKVKQRTGKATLVTCEEEEKRALVILFLWINSEPRVMKKYVDVYLNMGNDVMTVSSVPWQILLPTKGAQVSANNVLDFLNDNLVYQDVFVHAMSIGGYVWSEAMVKVNSDLKKYRPIISRIKGQIYESVPPPPPTLPSLRDTLLIQSDILAWLMTISIRLYIKINRMYFTNHVMKCSQIYNKQPLKIPTLLLLSKSDPISPFHYHMEVFNNWKSYGIEAHAKLWEHAPHIGILQTYRLDYLKQIYDFMSVVGFAIPKNKQIN